MRNRTRLWRGWVILVCLVLLTACGGGKKPDLPIPTVIAVLEKPYGDDQSSIQQPTPTELQPSQVVVPEFLSETPSGSATPTNQTSVPNAINPTATLGAYPHQVPTVSFSSPTPTHSGSTPTSTGSTNGLPTGLVSGSAIYTLSQLTNSISNPSYSARATDQSAVWVRNGAQLTLVTPVATCTGQTSSSFFSLNYGLNACLLSMEGSTLNLTGGNLTTLGAGSSGVFALGNASKVVATQADINTTGNGALGAAAENGGSLELNNTTITTNGNNSTGVSVNMGGSNAMLRDTAIHTSGTDSPCLYSDVTLRTERTSCTATVAEAAIIENNGSLELRNSAITSQAPTRWGVLLYQGSSRDARTAEAKFNMVDGTLVMTDVNSPVFFVTNVNATISLRNVSVTAASGVLLKAGGQNNWGTVGENGGSVSLLLSSQNLNGDIQTDRLSSVVIQLRENSSLVGAINPTDTARSVVLSMDAGSIWTLTRNSYIPQISGLVLVDNRVANITGNGYNLYYDPGLSSTLGGKTYQLTGGGNLLPHP